MGIHSEDIDEIPTGAEYVTVSLSGSDIKEKIESVIYITIDEKNREGCAVAADLLDQMDKRRYLDKKTRDVLSQIRSVYKKNDLWLHEYNLQHYFCIKDEATEIIKKYLDAGAMLYDIKCEEPYARYAFYHSMRRVEILSRYKNDTNRVNYDAIKQDIDSYIERFPDFLSFCVQKGQFAIIMNKKESAIQELNNCIEELNKYSYLDRYTSELAYILGRLYEYSEGDDYLARMCYSLSARKNIKNYRSLYKLARFYQNRGKYSEAWNLYSELEEQLYSIANQKYLQPRESEYLFKVLYCKYRLTSGRKYESERSELENKIRSISKDGIESQEFYDDFYKGFSGKYRKLVTDRLKMQRKKWN